jgi:hypothetical protein
MNQNQQIRIALAQDGKSFLYIVENRGRFPEMRTTEYATSSAVTTQVTAELPAVNSNG